MKKIRIKNSRFLFLCDFNVNNRNLLLLIESKLNFYCFFVDTQPTYAKLFLL